MAGIKELRLRIKSVGSIKQITRAMEMVATTKLRRFQDRAVSSRPYASEITGLIGRLAKVLGDGVADLPLFREGTGSRSLVVFVTSDRGLCGAYNSNLFRTLETWRAGRSKDDFDLYVWGRKGYQYLTKRRFRVERYLNEPGLESTDYRSAAVVSRMICNAYLSGEYKDVWVLATRFESMAKYVPECTRFLPIEDPSLGASETAAGPAKAAESGGDIILEPDAQTIFELLVPRYLETRIYNSLLEALTSEYASRRFAMKNATDAAGDMQRALRSVYNHKRQETITKELLDIVGGSEALR
jgi:F-type H+-transporting ATPase subunit gamma